MLKKIGAEAEITSDLRDISMARKLILPGVGSFDTGMESLEKNSLIPVLHERVILNKVPILGICLGMQLMTRRSEEGGRPGLAWIDAETIRFQPATPGVKVPHMGWNRVAVEKDSPLVQSMPDHSRFYFVHSYYVRCNNSHDVLLTTAYGGISFHSGFHHENIWGAQFHPEKSHKYGMHLLRNFAEQC